MKEKNFQEISKRIKELLNSSEMDLIEICDVISDVEKQEVINILNYLFNNDKITKFGNKYKWKE